MILKSITLEACMFAEIKLKEGDGDGFLFSWQPQHAHANQVSGAGWENIK